MRGVEFETEVAPWEEPHGEARQNQNTVTSDALSSC
jgi:hypothetical protein